MKGRPRPAAVDVLPGPSDYQKAKPSLGRDRPAFTILGRCAMILSGPMGSQEGSPAGWKQRGGPHMNRSSKSLQCLGAGTSRSRSRDRRPANTRSPKRGRPARPSRSPAATRSASARSPPDPPTTSRPAPRPPAPRSQSGPRSRSLARRTRPDRASTTEKRPQALRRRSRCARGRRRRCPRRYTCRARGSTTRQRRGLAAPPRPLTP